MYIWPVSDPIATRLPSGLCFKMKASDKSFYRQRTLTRQTHIGTTEPKLVTAALNGGSVLTKRRGFSGMNKQISRTTARGVSRSLGVQRHRPSYISNQFSQPHNEGIIGHIQGSS